jgi:hypothetical protein
LYSVLLPYGYAAMEKPNKALQLTANSVRCAPAVGSS